MSGLCRQCGIRLPEGYYRWDCASCTQLEAINNANPNYVAPSNTGNNFVAWIFVAAIAVVVVWKIVEWIFNILMFLIGSIFEFMLEYKWWMIGIVLVVIFFNKLGAAELPKPPTK